MSILNKFLQTDDVEETKKPAKAKAVATKASAETPASTTKTKGTGTRSLDRAILVRPLTTEKSSLLMAQNQYVFEVRDGANKIMVKKAVKDMYGVEPTRVRMVTMPRKIRVRGRIYGIRAGWKKAVVSLPAGSSIRVNEGGA